MCEGELAGDVKHRAVFCDGMPKNIWARGHETTHMCDAVGRELRGAENETGQRARKAVAVIVLRSEDEVLAFAEQIALKERERMDTMGLFLDTSWCALERESGAGGCQTCERGSGRMRAGAV